MPVNFEVRDFKCFNQLKNGADFSLNTSDFTPNLVGNVGEKVKVSFTTYIEQFAAADTAEQEWNVIPSNTQIDRDTGSFLDDAIQIGDVFEFYADWADRRTTALEYTGEVVGISADGRSLFYSVVSGTATTSGLVTNVGLSFNLRNTVENYNTAIFLKFGLIDNDSSFENISATTGSQQVYYGGGIPFNSSTAVNLVSLGLIKDWVSGAATVAPFPTIVVPPASTFNAGAYSFAHEFIINPFYILSYRQFLINGTVPDAYSAEASLKYAFEIDYRKTLTNTGSSKIDTFDQLGGAVGWFGENFNGLNPAYGLVSIAYEDVATGDPLTAINLNNPTKAIITVENFGGAITDYSCGVYLFRVPQSEDEYVGTRTTLVENFIIKSETITSPATTSANVATSLVGGNLVIEYDISYTTAEQLRLTADDEYIFYVQVEDPTLSSGDSDRMAIISDFTNYIEEDFLGGFVDTVSYQFLTHGLTLGVDSGTATPITSVEDGVLLDATFEIDLNKNVLVNSIEANLIAYNPATGETFELDSYSFNIGVPPVVGGVQQIEVDTLRGYPLAVGDDFNIVRITTEDNVAGFQRYRVLLGQKITWQDWIPNPEADDVFFDPAQPNNNLNENASNYSGISGYDIRLALVLNVTGDDDLGRTLSGQTFEFGGVITADDYDVSSDGVSGVIETFDLETGNSLAGGILYNGKDTLFRATFQNADFQSVGIHRIEPSQNQGDGIIELSSSPDVLVAANIPLIPLSGESRLKFTKAGSEVVTECLNCRSFDPRGLGVQTFSTCQHWKAFSSYRFNRNSYKLNYNRFNLGRQQRNRNRASVTAVY